MQKVQREVPTHPDLPTMNLKKFGRIQINSFNYGLRLKSKQQLPMPVRYDKEYNAIIILFSSSSLSFHFQYAKEDLGLNRAPIQKTTQAMVHGDYQKRINFYGTILIATQGHPIFS